MMDLYMVAQFSVKEYVDGLHAGVALRKTLCCFSFMARVFVNGLVRRSEIFRDPKGDEWDCVLRVCCNLLKDFTSSVRSAVNYYDSTGTWCMYCCATSCHARAVLRCTTGDLVEGKEFVLSTSWGRVHAMLTIPLQLKRN